VTHDDIRWLVADGGGLDFYRDDGRGWERIDVSDLLPAMPDDFPASGSHLVRADVTPDGALWAYVIGTDLWTWAEHPEARRLARFDGTTWTTWGPDDGLPTLTFRFHEDSILASTDGTMWARPDDGEADGQPGCDGIASFDGETWTRYLEGRCIVDFDVAWDGAVWVLAGEAPAEAKPPISTYVIRP
jgi:hypothetical protein